jgi:hypothetical protein
LIIRVDLHFLPENLKSLIINSKELTQYAINDESVSESSKVDPDSIQLFEFNGFFASFKGILKLVLQNNSLDDYIVAEDLECENTFVILKEGDIEQLGLLFCDFCGLACASEDEKYIHQRAHYFM